MLQKDTPPPSPDMEDDVDEDDVVYMDTVDEVLDVFESDDNEIELEDDSVLRNDATCIFTGHSGLVFCGSLSKSGKLAISGDEQDIAYVWNTTSGEVILTCTNHRDSVTHAEFNHDDSYVATGDMSGTIQVWRMSDLVLAWNYSMGDMTWMQWHTMANVLLAGSAEGEIYMWKVPSGDCKIFQGNGKHVETGTIMPDGKRLAVGYKDGTIRIMDLKTNSILTSILPGIGHSSEITSLDCHLDNNLIVSAATDGKTILSASHSGKVIAVLQELGQIASAREAESSENDAKDNHVEAVAFCKDPDFQVIATGTLNGEIFIWETSKRVLRHEIHQESGVGQLLWKQTTSLLFSGDMEGIIRCFDGRSGSLIQLFIGHSAIILDINISKDGKSMITTSYDSTARIFNISNCN